MVENNKLFAEFLGWEHQYGSMWKTNNSVEFEEDFKFDTDWNWLMQVVEKIESGISEHISFYFFPVGGSITGENFQFDSDGDTKIEGVYQVCLEFINWYNENRNKV